MAKGIVGNAADAAKAVAKTALGAAATAAATVVIENLALDGLRLAPTDARAIFLGKAIGNTLILWLVGVVLLPVTLALFDVHVALGIGNLVAIIFAGSLAISAPGTVYAAIASNAEWRESRPAQFSCPEGEIVARVREVLARHDVKWG